MEQDGETGDARAQRRDRRRERLLCAGRDLFAAQGYDRTTIGQVCAAAKVSTRAFYEEFSGRQALLLAICDQVAGAGMLAVACVMQEPDIDGVDTATRIGRLFAGYIAAITRDPAAAKVAFVAAHAAGHAAEEQRQMWRSMWSGFLGAEAGRAVERKEAADREHTLGLIGLVGAVNELMAHWCRAAPGAAPAPSVLSEELTRLALAVLGSRDCEEW